MKQEDWTEQLRDRLADHEEPVASDLWDAIEAQVVTPRHHHHAWRRWAAAAAVALLLSGGALLLWKDHDNSSAPNSPIAVAKVEQHPLSSTVEQTMPPSSPLSPSSPEVPVPSAPSVPVPLAVPSAPSAPTPPAVPSAPVPPAAPSSTDTPPSFLADYGAATPLPSKGGGSGLISPNIVPSPSQALAQTDGTNKSLRLSDGRHHSSFSTESSGLTAALFTANGFAGQHSTTPVQMSAAMAQRFSTQSGAYGARNSAPIWLTGYEEQTHHQLPVSFGLTFSLPVSNRLSVGTGIAYSRLQSEFTTVMKGWQVTREQTLHYVGVPLNLHYTLLPLGRFNLYASAGVQADINVLSRMKTNTTETDGEKDHCQWSLHSSVGLSYRLSPHLALYAEPGLRHMLDNHSNIQNYYKDKPTSLSLQLGLRLSLKK